MKLLHWYEYRHKCIAAGLFKADSSFSLIWVADSFWAESLWASGAHWEAFLSALKELVRQLLSRGTVKLSSYQLLTLLLPSPTLLLSVSFSVSAFVHWPVSWRLSDGCGCRMEVSKEHSPMNTAPPTSQSPFQCCLLLSAHFWMLHQ